MLDLKQLVLDDIKALGTTAAARKYDVHINTAQNWMKGKDPSAHALQLAYNEHVARVGAKSDLALWEGKKVYFGMPIYKHVEPATLHTLFANYAKYGADRIGLLMTQGEPKIDHARNILVQKFLKTSGEYLVFIDDDVVLPCGSADIMNGYYGMDIPAQFAGKLLLDELLKAGKHIIGALYVGRNSKGVGQFCEAFRNPHVNQEIHNYVNPGIRETDWCATGALLVHRSVFERMIEMAPQLFPEIIPAHPDHAWGFFTVLNSSYGEDVSFALRAKKCGFQSYVHTGLICGHVGSAIYSPSNTR